MITIKRTGQADITEATMADIESVIDGWDDPVAYVDAEGRVCVYETEDAYDEDADGAYPDSIIEGDGADDLAEAAGIDILCRA